MIPTEQHSALAERVEAAHVPDSTATRPPPPATGESVTRQCMSYVVAITTGPSCPDCIPPQTPPVDSGELIIY